MYVRSEGKVLYNTTVLHKQSQNWHQFISGLYSSKQYISRGRRWCRPREHTPLPYNMHTHKVRRLPWLACGDPVPSPQTSNQTERRGAPQQRRSAYLLRMSSSSSWVFFSNSRGSMFSVSPRPRLSPVEFGKKRNTHWVLFTFSRDL